MVAELIAGQKVHAIEPRSIAGCTYCTPQIASVGLTEEDAKKKGLKIKIGRFPFIGNGKAIALSLFSWHLLQLNQHLLFEVYNKYSQQ
jgi:dihydrolipoamide dehydrogenase